MKRIGSGTPGVYRASEVRGCDLWTFRDGMVVKKDSYWKIRKTGQFDLVVS